MKKLMKKKVSLFGKEFSVFAIAVVSMMVMVSAALVPYISNTITGNVVVDHPLEMTTSQENYGDTYVTLTFNDMHGGEEITYKTWTQNDGLNDVDTYPITTISSNFTWTGAEFTEVLFRDENWNEGNSSNPHPLSILDMLYVVKDDGTLSPFTTGDWNTTGVENLKELRIFFDNTPNGNAQTYLYAAGTETWINMTITTALTIKPDTYTIKLCHVDNLVTGYCA